MKTRRLIGIGAALAAAFNLCTAMAMGKKPPMDDSESSKISSIAIETIYRDQHCNVLQAHTRWIDSPQAYQALFDELRKTYVGGQAQQPPPVDLSKEGVLLLAMGQKRTGGYAVDLAGNEAVIEGGVLKVSVQWREPKPGMMLTQVLTSPCLLLKTPKVAFDRIEIKDQTGTIRLSGTR